MRWTSVVVVGAVAACVSSDSDTCPSGGVCAPGTRCVVIDAAELCVPADAFGPCDDLAAGDACGDGRCYESAPGPVCLVARCGNGFVERYEEVCDDGNNTALDGCAGDCRSDETCGNGVLDTSRGEECDDGNLRSRDGCASICTLEHLEWLFQEHNLTIHRVGFSVVFDTRRGEAIAFGGRSSLGASFFSLNDIRTWRHGQLTSQPAASGISAPPVGRSDSAMAFDDRRGVAVVFGGAPGLADTWEWNGRAWRFREAAGPPARSGHVMAYDRARRRVVLFGGREDLATSSETWEWDGEQWHRLELPGAPAGATARAAAYDPSTGRTVVLTTTGTWTYDGASWVMAAGPVDASELSAAFDTQRQQVLALGVAPVGVAHLWAFDGAAWIDLGGHANLAGSVLTYDPTRQRAIAWGPGVLGSPQRMHEWDGSAWIERSTVRSLPPVGLQEAAGAHDYLRRRAVVFGGGAAGAYVDTTWFYGAGTWTDPSPTTKPSARGGHAMAYDGARDEIVLFGGRNTNLLGDTWVLAGDAWSLRTPAAAPPARRGHVMAYDPVRERVVLFGGSSSTQSDVPLGDTWEWDGTTWTQVPGAGPAASAGGSFAYDRAARTLVYFDGDAAGVRTWTFDGTWHAVAEVVTPVPRTASALAWDASRHRLAVYGGKDASGQILPTLGDLWEWYAAAATWRRLPAQVIARRDHVSLTCPDGAGILNVYGDGDSFAATPLPSIVSWRGTAPEESCVGRLDGDDDGLVGCADPDCWASCAPACLGDLDCTSGPRCGDGTCSALESAAICPDDCGPPPVICGDAVCDPGETCIGDCT